ncbi:MAG: hypothetical protein JSU86_05945 [Phycisphaerales bacterium]|nr:MAG: hypothetical protein JSU86_05945 [Phycisphaerales bacterium]
MHRLLKCTLLITVCYFSSNGSVRADELRKHLAQIDMQKGRTDTEKLEKQCLDLLDEYTSPADQGRIYAQIAHVYAQSGLKDPDRLAEYRDYCDKALQYRLNVVTAMRMYGYWASALQSLCRRQVKWPESPWHEFADTRREIATLYLRGIKIILDRGTPGETRPLPMVHKVNCHPADSPSCQESLKKNEERRRARARVMLDNDLVFHRKMLIDHCVHIYSQKPVDTEELAAVAREILGDEDAVTELLTRVARRIMNTPDTGRTKRDE